MREYSMGKIGGLASSLPDTLAAILSQMGAPKSFDKGSQIYRQGEDAEYIFFLLRGRVKSTLIGSSGQEAILRIHLPHSIMGLTALSSDLIRDASTTCLNQVSVVPIKRTAFLKLMRDEPEFGIHIVRLLTDRMRDFHYRVGDWLAQSVEQRLSRALQALSTPDGNNANESAQEIPLTHDELAQLINTRRPTVSKALSKLADMGLVKQCGRQLIIIDREQLTAHATALSK